MAEASIVPDVHSNPGEQPVHGHGASRPLAIWTTLLRKWVTVSPLVIGILAWLWPIGVGGQMPVGGDVTQFSMGLMAFLHDSLRAGRLPLWNDLWGFGFPGLAESQMGVFYPPHLALYGLLTTERAYTASLVLHTLWGGLGTYWAARRIGISPAGGVFAGLVWTTSGFFLIHLPHQWGYTVGSWMPWAWGLAWPLVMGYASRRAPLLLALVLTLQVLPGHFQLAFCTQVSLLVLAGLRMVGILNGRELLGASAAGVLSSAADRGASPFANPPPQGGRGPERTQLPRDGVGPRFRGPLLVLLAVAAVFPLAAMQLWPTLRLARLADSQRDFEYLSGFAATPIHLVSYLTPGLFHQSPLWRPIAWDPFHTSPEEHLAYVGLVPLFLALGAIRYGWRSDPAVRALTLVALVTVLLSLGPYAPGFRYLIMLPGFSFFRAPARWGMATAVMFSLLAGRGFDTWRFWPNPGRSLARFVGGAIVVLAIVLLAIELALLSTGKPGLPAVAALFERGLSALPWSDPDPFGVITEQARSKQNDLRVQIGLARQGWKNVPRSGLSFSSARFRIYREELIVTTFLLALLACLSRFGKWPRVFSGALVGIMILDLGIVGRWRPVDVGPIRSLTEQSSVLGELAELPRGMRLIETRQRNLPMVSAVGPVLAYRTLDLPALPSLTQSAALLPRNDAADDAAFAACRATGAKVRILDPFETLAVTNSQRKQDRDSGTSPLGHWGRRTTLSDPTLAGWLFSPEWVALREPWASTFMILEPDAGSYSYPRAKGISGRPLSARDKIRSFRPGFSSLLQQDSKRTPAGDAKDGVTPRSEVADQEDGSRPIPAVGTSASNPHMAPTSRAWLVSLTQPETWDTLTHWSGNPADVTTIMANAVPLPEHSTVPERVEIEVQADNRSIVVISQLADPQWRATWAGASGERPAIIERVFGQPRKGAWQGVEVPEPGKWILRLEYVGSDVQQGLTISGLAWLFWGAAFLRWGRGRASREGVVP